VTSPALTPLMASGVQGGHARAYDSGTVLMMIIALAVAAVGVAIYVKRRRVAQEPISDHWVALAVMGELCPDGWQAQVTLHGWGAPVPDDAPPARTPLVALEWKQFGDAFGRVVVQRRVWANTIEEALQKMVDDRRLDVRLEQIASETATDDAHWT
jgi:hypothetical protein